MPVDVSFLQDQDKAIIPPEIFKQALKQVLRKAKVHNATPLRTKDR